MHVCAHYLFFIHSSVDGHFGCFHLLTTVNNAVMNLGGLESFLITVFVFFRYILRNGIAESFGSSIFSFFKKPPCYLPQWLHQFTLPPTVYKGSFFSTSLPIFVLCVLFDDSHSDMYEVASHCISFDLHFSDD